MEKNKGESSLKIQVMEKKTIIKIKRKGDGEKQGRVKFKSTILVVDKNNENQD